MRAALTIYLGAAVLTYGITLGMTQGDVPDPMRCRLDAGLAVLLATMSPFSTVVVFCLSGFAEHGVRFRCIDNAEPSDA